VDPPMWAAWCRGGRPVRAARHQAEDGEGGEGKAHGENTTGRGTHESREEDPSWATYR